MRQNDDNEIINIRVRRKEGNEPYPPVATYNLALKRTLTPQERKDLIELLDEVKRWIELSSNT